VSDKGYESREDILNCLMNGTVPNVCLKYDKDERIYNLDYEALENAEELKNSTNNPCNTRVFGQIVVRLSEKYNRANLIIE